MENFTFPKFPRCVLRNVPYVCTLRYVTLQIDTYESKVHYSVLCYVTLREGGKQA